MTTNQRGQGKASRGLFVLAVGAALAAAGAARGDDPKPPAKGDDAVQKLLQGRLEAAQDFRTCGWNSTVPAGWISPSLKGAARRLFTAELELLDQEGRPGIGLPEEPGAAPPWLVKGSWPRPGTRPVLAVPRRSRTRNTTVWTPRSCWRGRRPGERRRAFRGGRDRRCFGMERHLEGQPRPQQDGCVWCIVVVPPANVTLRLKT